MFEDAAVAYTRTIFIVFIVMPVNVVILFYFNFIFISFRGSCC